MGPSLRARLASAAVRPRRLVRLLLVALLLPAVAACGSREPSDEEQVRATLTALAEATRAKDYARLCEDVFARELLDGISRIGLPCQVALRQAYEELEDPRLAIGRVSVEAETATAEVRSSARGQRPSTDTVRLVKEDGGWRVSSLGDASAEPPRAPAP